jgi:tRNA(Ile)-lysidine synthase
VTQSAIREIERCVGAAASGEPGSMVLAVSGGLDSMVLLDAAAHVARRRVSVVATFDHGSGAHAARAVALVCREASARGLPVVVGHADRLRAGEAEWREARWAFLRAVARSAGGAAIVTAHTEDDQIETVLMRALRGAGARGLAGLYALSSDVRRPFVALRRATLERYAVERGVPWVSDPTNESRAFFRNRVRHELLPALLRARPGLDGELLAIAHRAAEWRRAIDDLAVPIATVADGADERPASVSVAVSDLANYDAESLAVLWPALAARVGLALDRRGTRRLVAFTISSAGRVGASMPLAGGWEVIRDRTHFTLRRMRPAEQPPAELPTEGVLRWGRWSFGRHGRPGGSALWRAVLPGDRPLVVRGWRPGDRMVGPSGRSRRVKRFFGDAGIVGPDRAGWPVVLAGEEIVWIPGVGRGAIAGASRTPGLIYSCELNDR